MQITVSASKKRRRRRRKERKKEKYRFLTSRMDSIKVLEASRGSGGWGWGVGLGVDPVMRLEGPKYFKVFLQRMGFKTNEQTNKNNSARCVYICCCHGSRRDA